LTDHGIEKYKKEKKLVLAIMEKLGPEYSVFFSTFHSNRFTIGPTWTMASFSQFIEALKQE